MSQEEARKLLDAWSFFDKHPEAKNWEGMPRAEFYRLVQIIAGTDNLVEAKEYFEGIATGTITGDMPTALLEAQKEGQDISKRLSTSKGASRVTKNWLAKLSAKGAEQVADKQVAAAQVRAVIERAEEETPAPKEVPKPKVPETVVPPSAKTPSLAPASVPSLPSPPEGGIGIKISNGAFGSFEQLTKKATATPLGVISLFSPPRSSATPQARAAVASAMTLSQIADRAEKLPRADKERILSLVENLRKAEFSFVQQTQLAGRFLSIREITILSGPEFGMDRGSIVALLGGGLGIPEKGPSLFARIGQQLFGQAAQKATNKVISEALTKAGISVAGKAAVAVGAEAAVGAAAGPPGWVVAAVALGKELLARFVSWLSIQIREHGKEIIGGALVGTGVLIGGTAGFVVGVAGGAIAIGGSGFGAIASGIGGFLSFGFTSILLPSIGIPILIALLTIPTLVAIILFIINSGAYLIPPSTFSIAGENPYIGVVKEASRGTFENSELPISVTYKISLTAKKGTLSNIKFEHKCQAVAKNTTFDCPAPLPDAVPTEISPVEPYVYTYNQTYAGTNYKDSLVINTFTVTADSSESQGNSESGTASIIIGNPPTGCYNVAGSWPASEKANILSAVSTLVGSYPHFVGRLCSAWSQVNLYYDPPKVCGPWGCAPGGNVIYFNSGGLGNVSNATYILAHESGHVLAYGMPSLFQSYLAFPGTLSELPVCTYGGSSPDEGFAEAIARFAARSACLNDEPNNKKFVESQIFR